MTDQPNTMAKPVRSVAIIVPTEWEEADEGEPYFFIIERVKVNVVDFYREAFHEPQVLPA